MARILLADDDASARDLVQRVLTSAGHDVRVAHDGHEALSLLEGGAGIDVLVTDVHMPGLDGIELAQRVLAANAGLRILLMSGFPEQLARGRQSIGGRIETLTKPCTLEDLRAALGRLLA